MNKEQKKGFTLVELLATIVIISLVLGLGGYYIIKIIHNSQDKTSDLSLNNMEEITHTYIVEYSKDIIWEPSQSNANYTYTCVPIQELVNKDYLDQETRNKYSDYENIIITRDESQNIINEQLDDQKICSNSNKKVAVPKAKDYCNSVIYNKNEQTLTQTPTHNKFIFINNTGTNAGEYTVTAQLQEGYIWEDSTTSDKNITCRIQKATPTITLTPNGSQSNQIETITTTLKSTIDGKISIKSSNPTYATTSLTDSVIHANKDKTITIQTLASKSTTTYLTFTITPTDTKNYYSSSVIYTIGNIQLKPVDIPTADKYCKTLTYTGNAQKLVNTPETGYNFINTMGTNVGEYTVTAKLKYGYIWKTTTLDQYQDITFTCQIKKKTPTIKITPETGEVRKDKTITFQVSSDTTGTISLTNDTTTVSVTNISSKSIAPNTPATITLKGLTVTDQTTITTTFKPTDEQNYETNIKKDYTLKIKPNEVKVNYNSNGGTTCNPSYKTVIYEEKYGTLCTTTKTGYTFKNWNFDGTTITKESKVATDKEHTLSANWTANQYTITLDNQNATTSGDTSATATYNETLPSIKIPIRQYTITYNYNNGKSNTSATAAYTFNGYFTEKNGQGTKYYDNKGIGTKTWDIANKTTLYASWTATSVTLPTPTKTGYTFSGWYNDSGTKIGNAKATYTPTSNITLTAHWTANTYKISYDYNEGTKGSKNPTAGTYDSVVTISNPTKIGYTFLGWEFNGNTSTAKYGTTKSTVTTSWSDKDTKVTEKYFKNLTPTNGATVKLTANWKFELKVAKHALNGQWYVWYQPGYVLEGTSIVYRTGTKTPAIYNLGTDKYNEVRDYLLGVKKGTVYAYIDSDGNILKDKTTYYRKLGSDNREFIKIFISTANFTQDGLGKKLTTEITETFTRNGTTYYGVWLSATCTPNGTTCPSNGISITKN